MAFLTVRFHHWLLRAIATLVLLLAGVALAPPAEAAVTLPPGSITVPDSGTFLYMNSEPGDYIGQGLEQLYTSEDSNFTASLPEGGDYFHAWMVQGNYDHWWSVDLAAPSGQPLVVGSYTGAERASFRSPGAPGIDVTGDGRGCNELTGQFDVTEVSFAPSGELLTFDATFEQHCEGWDPALFGRIRIENAPPPPDATAPELNLPADITVEAGDGSGATVDYSVSATDDRDPSPTVACTPASGSLFPVGSTTVTCTATDQSGNVASGTFAVHVVPPLALEISASKTGQVDRSGNVTVSGTVSCSRDVAVSAEGSVKQLFANRVTISGSFSIAVTCAAPQSPWSAVVTGSNGKFAAGNATLTVNAYACELSCHSDSVSQSIRLSGKG